MTESGLLAKAVARVSKPVIDGRATRILDAALHQFEQFGINRTTVEDIARRSGLARVTLYRAFPGKDQIVEAVVLRELANFLAELDVELAKHPRLEDKLVEGFVLAHAVLRGHTLLTRLLATEPLNLLPHLTTEGAPFIRTSTDYLVRKLAEQQDEPVEAELRVISEMAVRLILSFLLTPPIYISLDDEAAARTFAYRFLPAVMADAFGGTPAEAPEPNPTQPS